MTGVYYMYVIKFVPSHLRDSSRTVVGHLRDLELGEGHEFKSHLELLYISFHSFFLACFLVFSALKRVHAQIVQYAMR